jgi:hypothetical protein
LEAKKVKVFGILIHRSRQGTFIRSDVQIEPFDGKALVQTEFEFLNCKVLPFYEARKSDSFTTFPISKVDALSHNIVLIF